MSFMQNMSFSFNNVTRKSTFHPLANCPNLISQPHNSYSSLSLRKVKKNHAVSSLYF